MKLDEGRMSADGGAPSGSGCAECGRADAVKVGERWLCVECYSAAGSCCAGEFAPESENESAVQDRPDTALSE